ncbi:hypothetical protein ACHAPT_012283 [Fusarium lateritium]
MSAASHYSDDTSTDTDREHRGRTNHVPPGAKSPRSQPIFLQQSFVNFVKAVVFGLVLSVLGPLVVPYIVRPSAIPLPVHRPLIDLTKTLHSLNFTEDASDHLHFLKSNFTLNCSCPLDWIRSRRQYLPENANGLWGNDLWGDIPSDLPGKLDGFDDNQMADIALSCEKVSKNLEALFTEILNLSQSIDRAHSDALRTISAIVGHIHRVYWHQLRGKHKGSSDYEGWVAEGYLNELGTSVADHLYADVEVQDELLGSTANKKGSTYKRRNPRAFTTQRKQITYHRHRLYSSVALASTLSHIATNASLLQDQVRSINAALEGTTSKGKKCLIAWREDVSVQTALESIPRAATRKAARAHQAITGIDALRVSLRGFWGTRPYDKEDADNQYKQLVREFVHLSLLGNETALAGDLWQATWTWLGLQTEFPTSAVSLGSFLGQWLPPRRSVQLVELKDQHGAFVDLYTHEVKGRFSTSKSPFDLSWPGDYGI